MNLVLSKKIQEGNFEFVLLILFYLLHNCNEYFSILDVQHFFVALGAVLLFALVVGAIAYLFIRRLANLALFLFTALIPCLYYQGIELFVKNLHKSNFELYSKIVCIFVIAIAALFFRRVHLKPLRFLLFLKVMLLTLIVYEAGILLINATSGKKGRSVAPFVTYTSGARLPDVYLIVMDEYAGAESLQQFHVDNSSFLNDLKGQGFRITKNARSNYSYTVPSVASFLNGEFIPMPKKNSLFGSERYKIAIEKIYNNKTASSFQSWGYRLHNYSPFPFQKSENSYQNWFIPVGSRVLISMSILDDLYELMPMFIARRFATDENFGKLIEKKTSNNRKILVDVLKSSSGKSKTPNFYYVHLMMPHAGYAYTRDGKVNIKFMRDFQLTEEKKQQAYIDYLLYANTVMSPFLKNLKQLTNNEAVILVISDHGARDLAKTIGSSASFNSFQAMFWPSHYKTDLFYDGMSNVNLMPLVFSTISGVKIPLQKDSVSAD